MRSRVRCGGSSRWTKPRVYTKRDRRSCRQPCSARYEAPTEQATVDKLSNSRSTNELPKPCRSLTRLEGATGCRARSLRNRLLGSAVRTPTPPPCLHHPIHACAHSGATEARAVPAPPPRDLNSLRHGRSNPPTVHSRTPGRFCDGPNIAGPFSTAFSPRRSKRSRRRRRVTQ